MATREKVLEFLSAIQAEQNALKIIRSISDQNVELSDLDEKGLEVVGRAYTAAIEKMLPNLLDITAGVYAKHYTDDEISQLTTFYTSPLAQRQTSLAKEINEAVGEYLEGAKEDIVKIIKGAIDDVDGIKKSD
ncbi:DUF2059 domain-containing protein [Candidatus Kaiserbacteria bacterium]|nr:DUF2059 domain-containing protein [Candidatus Kaiserbacteria bacterium]